jgi:hypothetical protein
MLTKLLERIRPGNAERIARAKARLLQQYPGSRNSIWKVVGVRGQELATFGGAYRDVLQWAFNRPAFFEHGQAGDIIQLLPVPSLNQTRPEANPTFTQQAMKLPRFG